MITWNNNFIKKVHSKAIFLDRDGTINVEKHYMYRVEDFEFEQNAVAGLQELSKKFSLIIVTNQTGIYKNLYSVDEFNTLQMHLMNKLTRCGVEILGYAACPHGYECKSCRKPGNKMLEYFLAKYCLDRSKSWMIGDKISDIQAGKSSNLQTALVKTGYGINESKKKMNVDLMANDLFDFHRSIIEI